MPDHRGRICLLVGSLIAIPSCGSEPRPADSLYNGPGSAPAAEMAPVALTGAIPEPADDGSLCAKYGGMESVRQVTEQLLTRITGDCRIRAFFAGLTEAGGQRVADCLSIQIGELFGCAGASYAKAHAGNGLECRDMRKGHIGLGITGADFAALIEDVGLSLAAAGIDAMDIDAAATGLRALAPQIVEVPENPSPSRSQCGSESEPAP